MAFFTVETLRLIADGHPPRVAVETGTWHGDRALLLHNYFPVVHTIELSVPLYLQTRKRLAGRSGLHCHYGDSVHVLPMLCKLLGVQPVLFYLDAHWFAKDNRDVVGKGQFPLWGELRAIAERRERDIVVIDDVHNFGHGPEPDWQHVSLENIVAVFEKAGRKWGSWSREGCDQVAVYLG